MKENQTSSQPEKPASFCGFEEPKENWSKLPHDLIAALPLVDTVGEMKVILYILRHTWGYKDTEKKITLDEFEHGRKRKDGTRLDGGTGLSRTTIADGLSRAEKHGFIEITVDDHDLGRIQKIYRLKDRGSEVIPQGARSCPSDSQELHPRGPEVDPRTEKETSETNLRIDTSEKEEAPDGAGFFPDNGSGPQDRVEPKAEPEPPRPDYFDVAVRSHKKREERKAAGLAPSYSEGEGAVDGEPNSEALGAFCTIVGCDLMGLKAKVRTAWERELHRIAQNNEATSAELAGAILFEYGKGGAAAWKVVRSPFAKGFQEALPAVLAIWRSTSPTTRRRAGGGIVITNA